MPTLLPASWRPAYMGSVKRLHREREGSRQATFELAIKWIRIPHRFSIDRKLYDEARYLMALEKRRAPLLAFAAETSGTNATFS